MLNNSKWKKLNGNQFYLYNEHDGCIAILSYDDYRERWNINDLIDFDETFDADSLEEAQWRAAVILNNYCNQQIAQYMKIRDHLPTLSELYDEIKQ